MTENIEPGEDEIKNAKEICAELGRWGSSAPYGGPQKGIEIISQALATQREKYEMKIKFEGKGIPAPFFDDDMELKPTHKEWEIAGDIRDRFFRWYANPFKASHSPAQVDIAYALATQRAEYEKKIEELETSLGNHVNQKNQNYEEVFKCRKKIEALERAGDDLIIKVHNIKNHAKLKSFIIAWMKAKDSK